MNIPLDQLFHQMIMKKNIDSTQKSNNFTAAKKKVYTSGKIIIIKWTPILIDNYSLVYVHDIKMFIQQQIKKLS